VAELPFVEMVSGNDHGLDGARALGVLERCRGNPVVVKPVADDHPQEVSGKPGASKSVGADGRAGGDLDWEAG
jgi:hypothetical protein